MAPTWANDAVLFLIPSSASDRRRTVAPVTHTAQANGYGCKAKSQPPPVKFQRCHYEQHKPSWHILTQYTPVNSQTSHPDGSISLSNGRHGTEISSARQGARQRPQQNSAQLCRRSDPTVKGDTLQSQAYSHYSHPGPLKPVCI